MTQKIWNKCKKCGCDKHEDTEKLCKQCKAKRRQFWSDVKKVGGVAAGALLVGRCGSNNYFFFNEYVLFLFAPLGVILPSSTSSER